MDERKKLNVCRNAGDPDLYVINRQISIMAPLFNGLPDG